MLTKSRSRVSKVHRKRSLSIENLESRLNLSTVINAASRLAHLATPIAQQTQTYHKFNLIPVDSNTSNTLTATDPANDPFADSRFGDTSISNTSATSIDVSGYSAMSGAQIQWTSTGSNVGYMSAAGSSISYKLNVSAPGTYALNFGVSTTNSFGSFDVSVNGNKPANYGFLNTGSWTNYTGTSQNVYLAAGANTITIKSTWGSQFNINAIKLTPVSVTAVTSPTPTPTPTATPAGAQSVGNLTSISADKYSTISNSQLEWINGKPDIGYVQPNGSYVEYTLNTQTAGNYNFALSTAAINPAALNISVNGTPVTNVNIASTGAWANFNTTNASVYLPAGVSKVRFSSLNGTAYNLGNFVISQTSTAVSTPTPTPTPTTTSTATTIGSTGGTIQADKYSSVYNSKAGSNNGSPYIGYVTGNGAYVEYTLNVQTAGNYKLGLSTAAITPASLTVSVNGSPATNISIANTYSWSSFGTSSGTAYLPAGTVKIRFTSLNGTQYNLGNIAITPASATVTSPTPTPTPAPTPTPTVTPAASGGTVNVATQWMTSFNQLNVQGTSGNDAIYISQSGNTINVSANGRNTSYSAGYGNLVIKGDGGDDNITIDSSVKVDTIVDGGTGNDTIKNASQGFATVVTVGGGYDTVSGNGWNSSLWTDASDNVAASATESNGGQVHRISSFWGGVSTELSGQNLSDPSGTGSTTRLANSSLWGTGPTMQDVNQGQVADCFFLASIQTLAKSKANQLREVAVDLGDGTFAVQFKRNGTTTFVRVDADLPAKGPYAGGLNYSHPGASGDQWVAILEKAYAEFRSGAWSYGSLNTGYFGSVFSDLGFAYSSFGALDETTLYNNISSALGSGKGVIFGTNSWTSAGAPLIADHTYTITSTWKDGSGTAYVTARNPWGFDGAGSDGNTGDALITMTMSQLRSNLQAGGILM